jgi:hypothetical protein
MKSKKSSISMWSSTLSFSYAIKLGSTSHVDAKSMGFKPSIRGLNGWFLFTNINLSILFVWRQHLQNLVKMLAMEKICIILIWLVGMPIIYCASIAMVGNLVFFLHYQNKVHLQFSTST